MAVASSSSALVTLVLIDDDEDTVVPRSANEPMDNELIEHKVFGVPLPRSVEWHCQRAEDMIRVCMLEEDLLRRASSWESKVKRQILQTAEINHATIARVHPQSFQASGTEGSKREKKSNRKSKHRLRYDYASGKLLSYEAFMLEYNGVPKSELRKKWGTILEWSA